MQASSSAMVIVGAGHVGGRAAQALRAFGWDADQITHVVAWVDSIDPARREVTLTGGPQRAARRIAYEAVLLATGGHLRRLDIPGADLPGVLGLRTLDDAAQIAARLQPGARIAIVGGGFIGLEVAASARQRGCEVTVIEGATRLLGRAVPEAIGARVLALHRTHGVEIRLGTLPTAFERQTDGRTRVTLTDGTALAADTVLVGIGIVPAVELAVQAGLAVNRGIVVDAQLATSVPGVFAAGDVAEFPSPLSGAPIRQETWQNAEAQARVVAANMLGQGVPYDTPAWFWSDQYDHQLQVCGEPALGVTTVTRPLGDAALIDFHLDADGRLVGASGFGPVSAVAKELKLARMLVERRRQPSPEALADASVKLKSLL